MTRQCKPMSADGAASRMTVDFSKKSSHGSTTFLLRCSVQDLHNAVSNIKAPRGVLSLDFAFDTALDCIRTAGFQEVYELRRRNGKAAAEATAV